MFDRIRAISASAIAAAVLVWGFVPGPAVAAVVTFNSEAAYNAAVGAALFSIDFNSEPQAMLADGNFAGQVDFGSPEASDPSQVFFNSLAMTDAGSTTANNSVGPIDGVFANPVAAFGLVFSSSGNPQSVELFDSGAGLLGIFATNPGGFFGVLSDTSIASFIIRNGEFSPGDRDRFFVDDFRANAAIPVPAAVWMFLTALGGLSLFGWRRHRAAA